MRMIAAASRKRCRVEPRVELQGNGGSNCRYHSRRERLEAPANGIGAAESAAAGKLVIGGLKGSEQTNPDPHGHVVIVVAGPLAHDAYPSAYWGRLGGGGAKDKTINWAWREGRSRSRSLRRARHLGEPLERPLSWIALPAGFDSSTMMGEDIRTMPSLTAPCILFHRPDKLRWTCALIQQP